MRTPEEISKELMKQFELALHDNELGVLDKMHDELVKVLHQERLHQAKLEAERDGALADYEVFHAKSRRLEQQLSQAEARVKVLEAERDEAVKEADRVRTILNNSEVLRQMQLRDKAEQQLAQLQEENAKLKAERDEMVQRISWATDEKVAQLQLEVGRGIR